MTEDEVTLLRAGRLGPSRLAQSRLLGRSRMGLGPSEASQSLMENMNPTAFRFQSGRG